MSLKEESLKLHSDNKGKLETKSKVKIENQHDLSLAYTPGVAYVCKEIEANPEDAYKYTSKSNMVAVITDGSAVLGLGNIGQRVAQIALAFGMKVKALTSKNVLPSGVEKVSLEELLATSDVLSLHCPLTENTRHLINVEALRSMKPTAILINTGRGPLVDDQAVADALADGRLAAFCADVLTEEPPKADNPLLQQPNAFVTPHIAWASKEARIRLLQVATDNVRAFIANKPINMV